VTTLSDLRREEDFFDVTLAVDGKQVRAHKLVNPTDQLVNPADQLVNPAGQLVNPASQLVNPAD
jgi:hypothetical protein